MLFLASLACDAPKLPGTPLGTFTIEGTVKSSSCGAKLDVSDPWTFAVDLSLDGTTLYWRQDGSNLFGPVDEASRTVTLTDLRNAQLSEVTPARAGCSMTRRDTFTVAVGAEPTPTKISGVLSYSFSVNAGSDCNDQLTANGGTYETLPCQLDYEMAGERTSAP